VTESTDWIAWHRQYDDPDSSLSRRLVAVRARVRQVLDERTVSTVLSLCAGDGRDILPVLADLPADRRPRVTLVEAHPQLTSAASATVRADELAGSVAVITGDAGDASLWKPEVPVDLLMLCGIFGNISETDIRATIAAAAVMVTGHGTVIWTRGSTDPDLRPVIRTWFAEAGFTEVGWDSDPASFGVGTNRLATAPSEAALPDRLFTFLR